jgi:hypothetical protein
VNELLARALEVLGDTKVNDASTKARGRRAHARVLAMIGLSDSTERLAREQRIANLLTLARVDGVDADWALAEARRMLAEDRPAAPVTSAE